MRTKSFLFSMLAVAGMLFVSSCAQDEPLEGVADANYVDATFTLTTEDAAGTRATVGNGRKADKVVCGVFDKYGVEMNLRQTIDVEGKKATYKTRLAKGQDYRVVFFAYNEAAAAYDVTDLKNIEVKGGQNANIEERDAFTAYIDIKADETLNSVTKRVELRRPFAQLNLGINQAEYDAAEAAGIVVANTEIKVSNVYSNFSAYDNAVAAGAQEGELTFAMNAIPAEKLEVDVNRDGVIDENTEKFHYLALNYLLVGDVDTEKKLTDVEFRWENKSDATAADYKTNDPVTEFINIPVQRNYRTNIIGSLLTSPATFNIVIDSTFNGEYPDGSLEKELLLAATVGGEVTLTEDVTLNAPLVVNADMVINLNGNTITGNYHKSIGAVINNTANLKLVGGTIKSTAENGGSAIQNSGTMIVENVTLNGAPNAGSSWPSYTVNNKGNLTITNSNITSVHGAVASYGDGAVLTLNNTNIDMTGIPGFTSHAIYTYDNGKAYVNGGNIANNATDQNATGASVINGAVYVTDGNFTGRIENYYGTPVLTGGTYSVNPKAAYVADGYKSLANGDKWEVLPTTVDAIVSNTNELKAAVANAADPAKATVYMKAGTYDTKDFQFMNKTLNLKGIEDGVKIYNSQNNDVACTSFDMCTVSFENITIETLGGNYKGFARMSGSYKNCTIVNNYFTFYGKHVYEDCTFNAPSDEHCTWTYGATEVDFVNCKFAYSDRCVNVYVDNGGNAPGITADVAFTNCEFSTTNTTSLGAVEVNSSPFTAGVTVTLNNCVAPDYGKVVYVSPWDGTKGKNATITVDGKIVAGLASVLENAAAGSTIVLSEDVDYGTVEIEELKNITIESAENAAVRFVTSANSKIENVTVKNADFNFVTGAGQTGGAFVVINKDAEIENLVIEGCNIVGDGNKNSYGIYGQNPNASIVIKNCNISNVGYAVQATAQGGYKSLVIENCTFDNIISWAIMPQYGSYSGDLTITGCDFKNSNGGLIKSGALTAGHTFTFTNNTITNCAGHDGKDSKWFEFTVSAGTSVISGNTKDGQNWTPGTAEGLK